ncbi:MAG: hypothetical protein ACE5GR_08415 [Nitrosopumilus sp.]
MEFFSNFRKEIKYSKREKASQINGKHLKGLLKKFKEERDRIEKETGKRPQIDETTQMFMQKVLNVWISEGNLVTVSAGLAFSGKISFASTYAIFLPGRAVDHNRQFTHPVEYYEKKY